MRAILKSLFAGTKITNLPKSIIIIHEGDPADKLHYIISGYIKVYAVVSSGEQRIIFLYGPGDIFPLTTYLSGSNIAMFYYETMSTTQLQILNSKQFESKVEGNIEVAEVIMRYAIKTHGLFIKRMTEMVSSASPTTKVIDTLIYLVKKFGGDKNQTNIEMPINTREFAGLCGLGREDVLSQLKPLRALGVALKADKLTINPVEFKKAKTKNLTL
jgi:CRP-like cAMP-binding protein